MVKILNLKKKTLNSPGKELYKVGQFDFAVSVATLWKENTYHFAKNALLAFLKVNVLSTNVEQEPC